MFIITLNMDSRVLTLALLLSSDSGLIPQITGPPIDKAPSSAFGLGSALSEVLLGQRQLASPFWTFMFLSIW